MKITSLINTTLSLAIFGLTGCGGGGGSPAPSLPAGTTTISGIASKGPISGGDVTAFAIKNGQVDRTSNLANGKTAADGSYTLYIPPSLTPTGPIVIEVTGGTYRDEATGTAGVTLKTPLRATVANVTNGDRIAITPLTELAYKKVEGIGSFSALDIDDANLKIGLMFGVDNIVKSQPFDATQQNAPATATADDKKYAAALGVFSQMVSDSKGTKSLDDSLVSLMTQLETEVKDSGGFSANTVASLNTAITGFKDKNKSGTILSSVTFKNGVLTLGTSGPALPQGAAINGIDITITLPAGITVKADAITGELATGTVTPSSQTSTNTLISGKYTPAAGGTPATVRIIIANVQPGFALGEFAHLNFDGFPAAGAAFAVAVNQISGSSNSGATPATMDGIAVTNSFSGL